MKDFNQWMNENGKGAAKGVEYAVDPVLGEGYLPASIGVAACFQRSGFSMDVFKGFMREFSGLGQPAFDAPAVQDFANEVRGHTRGNLQESALAVLAVSQLTSFPGTTEEKVRGSGEDLTKKYKSLQKSQAKDIAKDEVLADLEELLGEEALYGEGEGSEGSEGTGRSGRGTGGEYCQHLDSLETVYRLAGAMQARNYTKFMDLLGKAMTIVEGAVEDHVLGSGQDSALTYGSDAARALPTELANSATFALKFAEGTLLQSEQQTTAPHGRGPVIMVVDQSGSMSGPPREWAIAMSFAALRVAQLQKRPFHCVQFAHYSQVTLSLENAASATAADYLAVATQWVDGGTNLFPAMEKALDLIDEHGYEGADIVAVSDGDWENYFDKSINGVQMPSKAARHLGRRLQDSDTGLLTLNYKKYGSAGGEDGELQPLPSRSFQAVHRACKTALDGENYHLRGGDWLVDMDSEGAAIEEVVRQVLADNDQV